MITSTSKRQHITPKFWKLKILKLPDIYTYSVSIYMYKVHRTALPINLLQMFIKNKEIHSINTRNKEELRTPLNKSKVSETFIKSTGVKIWNKIVSDQILLTTMGEFKTQIKNSLINKYLPVINS